VRILVTGARGGLGRAFVGRAPAHHDVHAFDHAEIDIGDHHAVLDAVGEVRPDVVVNLAAFTDVDANETETGRAFRDNALGPQSLAIAASAVGAALVHVSTDYVFDGEKATPYDETDEPRPISVYGRAKLLGEDLVRRAVREHVIVRTGYVYGAGDDYLSRQLARLRAGEAAAGLEDRVGSPTFVGDVADRLLPLALSARWGTFHLGGPEPASWFEVLRRCRHIGGFDAAVQPQRASELGLRAPRPRHSALVSVLVPHLGVPPMPPLDDGLREALAQVEARETAAS
jgi:dTDP-4-dehydrorhamnose reductase